MSEFKGKMLKSVNGHPIEKSWEINTVTGKIKKDSVVYTVFDDENFGAFYDCFKTLKEAQKCAKECEKGYLTK